MINNTSYSSCGCGNRKYYTKDEIDALLDGIISEEEITEIINNLFQDFIEKNNLEELIISIIGDRYTNEEIDEILNELETRFDGKYLQDITLIINGNILHNGDKIDIAGGGSIDISGKLDKTVFDSFKTEMEECCEDVQTEISSLWAKAKDLQRQINEIINQ